MPIHEASFVLFFRSFVYVLFFHIHQHKKKNNFVKAYYFFKKDLQEAVNFAYTQRVSTKTERKCRMRLLDGKTSLGGKKWKLKSFEENIVSRIQQTFNVPEVVARILSARGIPFEETEAFLHPSLRQNLPDPYILKDVEKASRRIIQSIENNETIGIMGDYDVDGATSSSLLKLFLEAVGVKTRVFIPDRADGYGPNIREMQKYYDDGIKLVVTVDCGMTAFEPIAFGTKLGLDIVILDHHEPEKHLPDAYAVVNPKRLDEPHNGPCYSMAAVGVVFLTIVAINRLLREQGFYQTRKEPDLKKWLDYCLKHLKSKGTFTIIHRPELLGEILCILEKKLGKIEVFPIQTKLDEPATRIIVRGVLGAKSPLKLYPPLIMHKTDGSRSDLAEQILRNGKEI